MSYFGDFPNPTSEDTFGVVLGFSLILGWWSGIHPFKLFVLGYIVVFVWDFRRLRK